MEPGWMTSQMTLSVGTVHAGSRKAVSGSGSSSMSDSLIFWKPRMEDPSKPMPSLNRSAENSSTGIEKCCHRPGRSVNLKSTILTPRSLAWARTAAGEVLGSAIFGPVTMAMRETLLSGANRRDEHAGLGGRRPAPDCALLRVRARSTPDCSGRVGGDGPATLPDVARVRLCRVHNTLCLGCSGLPTEMPKYDPLRDFLNGLPRGQKQVTLGFGRVEELLGEPLPPSAREYEQWWRGGRVKRGRIDANWQDQVQQRAWEDIGWTVEELDLLLKNVTFRRR